MKNKKWLRSVAFILLLSLAVTGLMSCYALPQDFTTRLLNTYEAFPDNQVDGLLIGPSTIAASWVNAVAWEKYGLTTAQIATSIQPFGSLQCFIEYAKESQDFKYVIIDVHSLRTQSRYNSTQPSKSQSTYLGIPNLYYRYKMLGDLFDYSQRVYDYYGYPEDEDDIFEPKLSYYLPFYNFHNRWVDGLEKSDFVNVENIYLGANDRKTAFMTNDFTDSMEDFDFDSLLEINDFQKNELELLFEYLEKQDFEVIFVSAPSFRGVRQLSSVLKYCADNGYDTINFCSREMFSEIGIDPATDFANSGHMNLKGAEKVTVYLCEYLKENGYYTEDHRGQEGYEIWDEGTARYNEFYEKGWEGKDVAYLT